MHPFHSVLSFKALVVILAEVWSFVHIHHRHAILVGVACKITFMGLHFG